MQILLSCAKTMSSEGSFAAPRTTAPRFLREAEELAARMAALTTDELARLLRVNGTLAAENRQRYLRFHDPDGEAVAALAAYTGIVFRHIAPERFTPDDLHYAQQHLHITSFLYGLLRPLDAIRPYRLEGDVRLPGLDEPLFDFWRTRLTDPLIEQVRADDGVLVNLASAEMKRLFDWKRLSREVRVVTPEFRIREGERLRTVVVYTKMCRGEMTRRLLCGRLREPDELKDFDWEGFRFDPAASRGDSWCFTLG